MKTKTDVLVHELKRMSRESRMQARGKRPDIALVRLSEAVNSLALSLDENKEESSPFTKREKEVLFHISQGFTNREIAAAFNLSEKTIEFHVNSILSKTNSASRTEAVAFSLKSGWLT